MSDFGSGIDVQDLVNGQGEWTNIQEVLRGAVVDVIRAVSRVDEKFVKELESYGKDMHEVRNHLVRGDRAHEKAFKSIAERLSSLDESLESYAKNNDIDTLKDQLLVFVHAKTKELASSTVVSAEQFADLKRVLETLPSKADFERVIAHLHKVETKNKKIVAEMAEVREEVTRMGETLKEKPDKPHYDTLTKRLLFLDRKVKAYSDKSDKHARMIYDIEESMLQLPSKDTIEELGDHIVGLVQAARMELGEQIGHATGKVDEFESLVNSKAAKADVAAETYAVTKQLEEVSASIEGKAAKSDLDLFVRDLSVLESSTMEAKAKNLAVAKQVESLAREAAKEVARPKDLQELEERVSAAAEARADEIATTAREQTEALRTRQSELDGSKSDRQEVKKVAKEIADMNKRFRDWHGLVRQASAKTNEIEAKLAEFTTKQEHQAMQKNLTSTTTKVKLLGDDQSRFQKKFISLKEEIAALPVKKDLNVLEETLRAKMAVDARDHEAGTAKVADDFAAFVKDRLPADYASKEDLRASREAAIEEANALHAAANDSMSAIEKRLALVNSELVDQLARKVSTQKFEKFDQTLNGKIASTGQDCTEQLRQAQLRMDRIESAVDAKADKIDNDMFTRDLSSLEQHAQLFSQQATSRMESLDSKVISLAESLNDQVEVSKKLHMDFLQKPDRDDIKLMILAEVNAKTKDMEQDNQAHARRIAELSTRLDGHNVMHTDAQESWQEDLEVLRAEVSQLCESVNSKHKDLVKELKGDTMKTMETVLEGLHKHEKERNTQMIEFEQQMRRRFEDASSKLNEQHNLEVAARIENETSIAESIRKLQVHLLQMDEANAALRNTVKHSVDIGGGHQERFDTFARQVNTKFGEMSDTSATFERDVNAQVISLQKKFTDISRDIVEAVDGRLSRCVSRAELEKEMETLKKVVSLKSKMALSWNAPAHSQPRRRMQSIADLEQPRSATHSAEVMASAGETEKNAKRILELETKVMELTAKKPAATSILSPPNEVGGLVRMWGDQYAPREKRIGDGDGSSGIVSLLDKSAQRILSIRTAGGASDRSKKAKAGGVKELADAV